MIPGIQVYEWFNEREENTADLEALNWVLAHWPELSQLTMRAISATDLKTIQQQIQQISTGKQRLYRQALDQLLQYLAEVCFWSVPEKQKKPRTYHLSLSRTFFHCVHSQSEPRRLCDTTP